MYYLSKILPQFVLPVGVTLMLLMAGLLLRRRWLMVTALIVLLLCSLPLLQRRATRMAEDWAVRVPAAEMGYADAIVVLSTGRLVAPGAGRVSEWSDADRFFGGVELLLAGRAPLLVFTGAWSPWQPATPTEGEVLAQYAEALGVPPARIAVTGRVFNTEEEAREVAALLRSRSLGSRVLLVTSALHMPRASAEFDRAGLAVQRFPVDFASSDGMPFDIMDFIPTAEALRGSERLLREAYGRLFFHVKSW